MNLLRLLTRLFVLLALGGCAQTTTGQGQAPYAPYSHVTGLREDLSYGSDESTLQGNSGKIVQAITSPKGNLIFGPWQDIEYYLSVGQGLHSNDLRSTLTNVDALGTEAMRSACGRSLCRTSNSRERSLCSISTARRRSAAMRR